MIMNKIIGLAVLLFCLSGCVRDNDAIYYPVGNVDVERGGPALEAGKGDLITRSYNTEDYVLDTLAQYPGDPTLGKLTFMVSLKNRLADQEVSGFNGVGLSRLTMSLGYKDGNYPAESQVPVYTSSDVTASYAIKLRLKGELTLTGDEWMIDYIYAQLAGLFQPYLRLSRKCLCVKGVSNRMQRSILFVEPGHLILLMIVPTFLSANCISICL